jgi:hypothetical protein
MNAILTLATLMTGTFRAPAAPDSTPAPSDVGNSEYPRIASDRRDERSAAARI